MKDLPGPLKPTLVAGVFVVTAAIGLFFLSVFSHETERDLRWCLVEAAPFSAPMLLFTLPLLVAAGLCFYRWPPTQTAVRMKNGVLHWVRPRSTRLQSFGSFGLVLAITLMFAGLFEPQNVDATPIGVSAELHLGRHLQCTTPELTAEITQEIRRSWSQFVLAWGLIALLGGVHLFVWHRTRRAVYDLEMNERGVSINGDFHSYKDLDEVGLDEHHLTFTPFRGERIVIHLWKTEQRLARAIAHQVRIRLPSEVEDREQERSRLGSITLEVP